MPTRILDAATADRVRRAALAARAIDPVLRQELDLAYHGATPAPHMLERLFGDPLAWDYSPATMQRLGDHRTRDMLLRRCDGELRPNVGKSVSAETQ